MSQTKAQLVSPVGGVVVSGVVTASSFVGNVTGTASTATAASTAYGLAGSPNLNVGIVTTTTLVGTSATVGIATVNTTLHVTGNYKSGVTSVSALDINCSLGNYFTKTVNGISTFTFSGIPTSSAYSFTLELTHTSGAITWPTQVKWPSDTAPTLTTSRTHLFMFVTDDGGTRWRGSSLVDYVN
jgi:hypothetical protein